jgi:succinate dehydrogenase/fumarate reductase-like Fe-S protein
MPVVRDLIVDMTQFFKQYHSIKPYVQNDEPAPQRETPAVAGRSQGAGRPVRMYSVRVLLDFVPVVLVES